MGCGATRRLQFAQVVPDHDDQDRKEAIEAGRRDQQMNQRRRSNGGRASQEVPAVGATTEMEPDRQGGEMPKELEEEEMPKKKQPGGELGLIFSAIVSEPKSLVSWSSHDFRPSAEELSSGHRLPPCAISQESHLRRLQRRLASITCTPFAFQDIVRKRRDDFDQMAQKLDGERR
eukprot:TRINITY_DN9445_c0_g2_i1.p1 TRINITY_DN9445_c0_g2~~TRINITY_DN9445_c0_g2_i1.p1  ORF type:complete len:175 (-),score=46.30 TRINITY_DN9445_c0_g2_i1:48-572(-)